MRSLSSVCKDERLTYDSEEEGVRWKCHIRLMGFIIKLAEMNSYTALIMNEA